MTNKEMNNPNWELWEKYEEEMKLMPKEEAMKRWGDINGNLMLIEKEERIRNHEKRYKRGGSQRVRKS